MRADAAAVTTALIDGFVSLAPAEQRLTVASYRLLAGGTPASPAAIAEAAGWTVADVERRLDDWPGGVYRDDEGAVVGRWGLAVAKVSDHRVEIGGAGHVWAWCAFDPLFIVPLLRATARVRSICPTSGRPLGLTVSPAGLRDVTPAGMVMSIRLPDRPFDDQVRQSFCHYVHFFASSDVAETWVGQHPDTQWLPVTDAFRVARDVNAAVFADVARTTTT